MMRIRMYLQIIACVVISAALVLFNYSYFGRLASRQKDVSSSQLRNQLRSANGENGSFLVELLKDEGNQSAGPSVSYFAETSSKKESTSLAIIVEARSCEPANIGRFLDAVCQQGQLSALVSKINIYVSESRLALSSPSSPTNPKNNNSACSGPETSLNIMKCESGSEVATINECLAFAAYAHWNSYYLLVKDTNCQLANLAATNQIAKLVSQMQSNTIADVGVVVYIDSSFAKESGDHPIFFHRNHLNLIGILPFPKQITNWPCSIQWLKEFYSNSVLVSFYKEVINSAPNKVSPSNCPTAVEPTTKDLFINFIINYIQRRKWKGAAIKNRQIISMSLYGYNNRYECGAIRNAQLIHINYPDWKLRFYIPGQSISNKIARPAPKVLSILAKLGAEIVDIQEATMGPMLWRFLVMHDENVDVFQVRDADDRLSYRDALCTDRWLQSGKVLLCFRDNPWHVHGDGNPLLGCMFGGRRKELLNFCGNKISESQMKRYGGEYMRDMNYLTENLWGCIPEEERDCCDTFGWWLNLRAHPFPPSNYQGFVGIQVFDCSLPKD